MTYKENVTAILECNFAGFKQEIIDSAVDCIMALSENKGEWIPVSEKLPSDCGHDWVLAQIQEDNGYLWIPCVAEYRKLFDDWFSEANEVGWLSMHKGAFKVVAWQPLPEVYKTDMRGEADEQT